MSPLLAAALVLGALAGEVLRRVVVAGRFRRAGDDRPVRSLWWGPPAGGLGTASIVASLPGYPPAVRLAALAAGAVLLLLALVDADVHRLPDALVRPLALGLLTAAVVASFVVGSPGPAVAAVVAGAGLYLAFTLLALVGGGLGYGDVKLAGAVGLGLGPFGADVVLAAPVLGLVLGGLAALALLVTGRAGRHTRIALGPWLAAGAVLALALAGA